MSLRKFGLLGNRPQRSVKNRSVKSKNSSLAKTRLRSIETLEKRELLAADAGAVFKNTGLYTSATARDAVVSYVNSISGGNGTSQTRLAGEGGPTDIVTVNESAANNDSVPLAQLVPLDGNFGVNITGRMSSTLDQDFYSFNMQAGDILDVRVAGGIGGVRLALLNSSSRILVSSIGPRTGLYPELSPLFGSDANPVNGADITLSYVIPTDGTYAIRVSDALGTYNAQLRQYRPVLESAPAGQNQILFLDFDGAFIPRSIFGAGAGTAILSPLNDFLDEYELPAIAENALINEVISRVTAKFSSLGLVTNNPGYGFTILNSRDHADAWGQENVTRVIIGGTLDELLGVGGALPDGLLGIAQSVDVGNFETEETVLVLQDTLIDTFGDVDVAGSANSLQLIAELMAVVTVQEIGHVLGGLHQDPDNLVYGIMDQFYDPVITSGAGFDEIFGTVDDTPLYFNRDVYSADGVYDRAGINDTIAAVGWALSTGRSGGTVTGTSYIDTNGNSVVDAGDLRLPGVTIYSDANLNGAFDVGEVASTTDSNGDFSLILAPGTHTIREVVPAGARLVTPVSNGHTVTVAIGGTISGRNFRHASTTSTTTGIRWIDANGDGIRTTDEPFVVGGWVYVDLDGDDRIDLGEPSAQTNSKGEYTLTFPGPGTYTVREVTLPGYVQSFPGASAGNEHTVTITGNPLVDLANARGLDFGDNLSLDRGDAPITYGDATHGFVQGLSLGQLWDADTTTLYSADATGDDVDGTDDEDGVRLARRIVAGASDNAFIITATNTTGQSAFVSAWIDLNQDGDFADAGEKVISDIALGTSAGTTLSFAIPSTATLGNTFARIRYSQTAGLTASGFAATGEVEDLMVSIANTGNVAGDDNYNVPLNSTGNILDVLANDFALDGETLTLSGVSATSAGSTVSISNNTILYSPPNGFFGIDTFTYTVVNSSGVSSTATVRVTVSLSFDNPVAVDDSFEVATGSVSVPLPVLANDIEGQNGALSIQSATQGSAGGSVTIGVGAKSLIYTPSNAFGGTETFTYTAVDPAGQISQATVTVHTLPGDRTNDTVSITLRAVDSSGATISTIREGEQFFIEAYVDDLRFSSANPGSQAGVFSAFFDLLYSNQLVTTVAPAAPGGPFNFDVTFFNSFTNSQTGNATIPGIVDELGAVSNLLNMNRPDPTLLARVRFEAIGAGDAVFKADPADEFPLSETTLFNQPAVAVADSEISFLGTTIKVLGIGESEGFTNLKNPMDVNADGYVSPIDVLGVINAINTLGSGPLSLGSIGSGEGESAKKLFIDVNADGSLSPIDVVMVINYLNKRASGQGEGESDPMLIATPTVALAAEGEAQLVANSNNADIVFEEVGGLTNGSSSSGINSLTSNTAAIDSLFANDTDSAFDAFLPDFEEELKRKLAI